MRNSSLDEQFGAEDVTGLKPCTEVEYWNLDAMRRMHLCVWNSVSIGSDGRGAFYTQRRVSASESGVYRRDNVGMSNDWM